MEGQLLGGMPDDDMRDIKVAIDYLHTSGYTQVFLVGEEIGCISILNYMSRYKDARVAGLSLLNPVESPPDWLRELVGDELYAEKVGFAGIAARQGAGMDVRIELLPENGPAVTQNALPFLNWWGPMASFRLDRMLENIIQPLLVIHADGAQIPAELAEAGPNREIKTLDPAADPDELAGLLTGQAARVGAVLLDEAPLEMVHAESAGRRLVGLLWSPSNAQPTKTALLLMHGLTSSPLSPLFLKMGPVIAQSGTAVIAAEVRRSGWAGHESALMEHDTEDLDVWVQSLLERGFEKIVLAGASIGSISVGRYQSVKQHPNVVAIAHLMPTADCPVWFRQSAGDGPYASAVEQAKTAIAEGRGDSELIDIDIRQAPPNKYGGRFRWTQRAASWLSWFGPDADSMNSVHIANAKVPLLLLSGTEDSYNDEARFAQLKAAAVNAPSVAEIWYPGIDHGLAGVETRVAQDVADWMNTVGAL
jgi:alpha-beta hydrolase superfamily lysophospholipase